MRETSIFEFGWPSLESVHLRIAGHINTLEFNPMIPKALAAMVPYCSSA